MGKYSSIFEPLAVEQMTIPNRIVMTPMGTNFGEQDGEMSFLHINYYEQRAMDGTGPIIMENACVDYLYGSNGTTWLRIDHDNYIPRLYKLVETIHKRNTKIVTQLNHAGASAAEERIGMQPVSVSDVPNKKNGAAPRALNKEEIPYIADCYAKAAKRAQIIGFDAVETHVRHSYLINQFSSPLTNKCTDEFGGSYENRACFARLVLEAVREEVGAQLLIIVHVSADEFLEGGNTLEDTLKLLEYFHAEAGIIDASYGPVDSTQYRIDANYLPGGWRSYMVKAVKEAYAKPAITTGNICDPRVTEDILEHGDVDSIGMGRQMIAGPSWTNKMHYGKEDTIRKCISCNIGCPRHRIGSNRPIHCSVNPSVNEGEEYRSQKVEKPYNVVIIGGGTADLEAACAVVEVGCMTFLIEKEDHLGGLNVEISKTPDKKRFRDLPNYLIHHAEKLRNLITSTSTEATSSFVKTLKPDFIINATGSTSLLPPISGLRENIDVSRSRVSGVLGTIRQVGQYSKDLNGEKVCVVGGGAIGLDVVEFFAKRGAAASIVGMFPVVGKDPDTVTEVGTCDMLEKYNVQVLTSTALQEVHPDHSVAKRNEQMETLNFDYGLVCLGIRMYSPAMEELKQTSADEDVELFSIDGSVRARRIIDGVAEGRNILSALKQKEPSQKRNETCYIRRN